VKVTSFMEKPCGPVGGNFGQLIPYGDPSWYQHWHSPYYNQSHIKWRAFVRKWVEKEITPFVKEWDESKYMPIHAILKKAAQAGLLGAFVGAPWPTELAGKHIAAGLTPEEFDHFHEFILSDELGRAASAGCGNGWASGITIGLPVVLQFGTDFLKNEVCRSVLKGDKVICLAITEPGAGSDVSNIQTEAILSSDGRHYIVNGQKKWITNGLWADYFTTAVRTGAPGGKGISVLVIPRGPGVKTVAMDCMGLMGSGTAVVTFEDAKVPVEYRVGEPDQGFKLIMFNFNHERMVVVIKANRFARVCYEEAFKYALKRETFGKKLIDHPVIRGKLAHMIRLIETTHALIESVLYQLNNMSHTEARERLGGLTALLKTQATHTFEFCAREASQIFGGLAYTRSGQGEKVERLFREARAFTVFAGSEEVMLDLGVRMAVTQWQKQSKL